MVDDNADEFETLDLLTRLVDKSLAVVERADARLALPLPRDRAPVRARGAERGRRGQAHARPAPQDVRAARRRRRRRRCSAPTRRSGSRRLESEHGNLLAALDWCASAEDGAARGLAFAAAVSRFWSARGYYELGWTSLKTALDRDTEAKPTPARGKALVRAGGLALYRGDYAAARPLIEESLEIHRAEGDEKGEARALSGVGTVATYQGDFDRARTAIEESLALYREARQQARRGDRPAQHRLHRGAPGPARRARRLFGEALAIARTVGDFEVRRAHALGGRARRAPRGRPAGGAGDAGREPRSRARAGRQARGRLRARGGGRAGRARTGTRPGRPGCPGRPRRCGRPWARRSCPSRRANGRNSSPGSRPISGADRTAAELAGGRGLGFAEAVALAREGLPAAREREPLRPQSGIALALSLVPVTAINGMECGALAARARQPPPCARALRTLSSRCRIVPCSPHRGAPHEARCDRAVAGDPVARRPRTPSAQAAQLFIDYFGYDYESPNPNPGTFGEPGSVYNSLGPAPNLFAPLVPDTVNNQYTYYFTNLAAANVQTFGSFLVIDYLPGGLFQVWEDAKLGGTFFDFGVNPPNAHRAVDVHRRHQVRRGLDRPVPGRA